MNEDATQQTGPAVSPALYLMSFPQERGPEPGSVGKVPKKLGAGHGKESGG